ncbi:hypothetical protein Q3O43_20040 [Rhodococcus aetherivorans]|uniref:hypothetical protein n=1 Tax=Rhodococcus aetherivorans TaxID=191292 RepID=UPI0026F021C8|nr:hypothetical protein [Rhodococcus aetherivorans]WKW97312.1 hypothetical protein Q3O43_20040 [Rhodococcus aetherivorans]
MLALSARLPKVMLVTKFDALTWFSHLTEDTRVALLADPAGTLPDAQAREVRTWPDSLDGDDLRPEAVKFLTEERFRLEEWWNGLAADVRSQLINGRHTGFPEVLESVGHDAGGVLGSQARRDDGTWSPRTLTLFTVGTAFLEMKARHTDVHSELA